MIKPTMLAPNFSADAYLLGNTTTVTLSNFINDWVGLFFYASDFTFV